MKRYISLACVALIVVMCMASPVSAAESCRIELLNYFDTDNFSYTFHGSTSINVDLTQTFRFYNYDLLFSVSGAGGFSDFYFQIYGSAYRGEIYNLGNGLYRVVGTLDGYTLDTLNLVFTTLADADSYVTLNSFKISSVPYDVFDDICYVNIVANEYDKTITYNVNDVINYRIFPTTSELSDDQWLTLYMWSEEWKKYDYIEFTIFTVCQNINSITCVLGEDAVPIDISFINSTSGNNNHYAFSVFIDCSSLNKLVDDYPMVIVEGRLLPFIDDLNTVNVIGFVGGIKSDVMDPDITLLRRIIDVLSSGVDRILTSLIELTEVDFQGFTDLSSRLHSLSSMVESGFDNVISWISAQTDALDYWLSRMESNIVSAIRGDTSPGNEFQQEVDQKDQQLNDMAAVMDSVNQPDLNSVNVSADTYVDSTVLAASMSGITSVFSQGLYFDMIVMSIMMATAGYVLFGKR